MRVRKRNLTFAPIVLFVYDRPWHTRQTVETLQKNHLAAECDLIIYSDGPKKAENVGSVDKVRNYVRTVEGFKSVTIIEREENWGLAYSIISGVTEVVSSFGTIIVLEDDLVTSPCFLKFMNDALDYYEDDARVVSIHGYMFPVAGSLPETFFLKDTGSWGWATWKRGWDMLETDGALLLEELRRRNLFRSFDMDGAYPFSQILKDQVAGVNDSWAIRWQAATYLKNGLTLFPGISLVNNIGLDSSGIHCGSTRVFESVVTLEPVCVGSIAVEENTDVLDLLKIYFRSIAPGLFVRFCMMLKRVFKII